MDLFFAAALLLVLALALLAAAFLPVLAGREKIATAGFAATTPSRLVHRVEGIGA